MRILNSIMIPLALSQQSNRTMSNQTGRVNVDGKGEHGNVKTVNLGSLVGSDDQTLTVSGNDVYTDLHTAAYNDHKDFVQLLLDSGFDVNDKDSIGLTLLHTAAVNGHKDIVQLLLDRGADVNAKDSDGLTALHWAAQEGYLGIVEELVKAEADVSATNKYGITALHLAVQSGHEKIVKLLRGRGADADGLPPANIASEKDHLEFLQVKKVIAASNGYVEAIRELIKEGVDLNRTDKYGIIPVNIAAENGHVEIIRELIKAGVDLNSPDKDGCTPLHLAVQNGHENIVELLLDRKIQIFQSRADVEAKDRNGATPLLLAAKEGHRAIFMEIYNKDANVNYSDYDGNTALHLASRNGHLDIVTTLSDIEANVDAKNNDGATALHEAAYNGHKDIVQLLLDSGADINATDEYGATALERAEEKGHKEIVKLLRDRGNRLSYKLMAISVGAAGIGCYRLYQEMKRDKQSKAELQDQKNKVEAVKTKVEADLEETNPNKLTTINCELKNYNNDDFATKYYVVNAGLEIPISEQEYNNLSKKNEIEENKKEIVEKYKKLLRDIEQCETIDDALKLERTKTDFKGSYKKLKERIENRNKEIESVIELEQYLEKCWNTINRNHMNVLSETKKTEINKELYNNTKEICKLLKLDVAAIKKIIHQIKIRNEVGQVAEEIYKNMKKLSEELVDQSEELGELYDAIKLQKEEIRTENNQEEKNKFIKILEELKAEYDKVYKEQVAYLAAVKISYTFIFQQFQGREIKNFLEKCSKDNNIILKINDFIRYLENIGIDSQGNGTIIGSTLSSMTMLSLKSSTTNIDALKHSLNMITEEIINFLNSHGADNAGDAEQCAIKQQVTKHLGLLRKLFSWNPTDEKTYKSKVLKLRENEGLQQKQCILNNNPHAEKQKQHHLNDTEKVQDDFKKGLERLNEEFCEYRLKRIELNDNQLASLAEFFINNANKISNNGSHYRLEYPGVILPSFHTPLKPADIIDNWIRLNIISSVLLVKPGDQHDK